MRLKLSKSKYRVLLSEVLPYEMPLFFSNRYFARFLKFYEITIKDGHLIAKKHTDHPGLTEFLNLLSASGKKIKNFNYVISKDGVSDGRRLTIMHPFHQIMTSCLYGKYDRIMVHFCDKSCYSIRRPWRVANEIRSKMSFEEIISDKTDTKISPESAKSYFLYKKYSNISKFYDDFDFLNLEKNFDYLLKIDVKKCFDSINPDFLPSLVYDIDYNKDESYDNDFIYEFVSLHKIIRNGLPESDSQNGKGIIIGPEVSRIFAEIFLQHIDFAAERRLSKEFGLICPKDYEFFRYVDDSFIAANSVETINKVKNVYSIVLESVGLSLKENKEILYKERPFINGLSLIKSKLSSLVEETFENKLSTFKGFKDIQNGRYDVPTQIQYKPFINQLRIIVAEARFSLLENLIKPREEKIDGLYSDVSSFVLGAIVNRLHELLKDFNELYRDYSALECKGIDYSKGQEIKRNYESKFKEFCEDLIESLFFILGSDLRMSTSINVVKIIDIFQRFVRGEYIFPGNVKSPKFPSYFISDIDECISKETLRLFRHKKVNRAIGLMEILNVLELQHRMYPRNRINERSLLSFLEKNSVKENLNYFTAFQLIHFTQGKKRYSEILEYVCPWICSQISIFKDKLGSDTESLLTVLSLLSMPSHCILHDVIDENLSDTIEIEKLTQFIQQSSGLYINWKDYNVSDELEQRKGHNVY